MSSFLRDAVSKQGVHTAADVTPLLSLAVVAKATELWFHAAHHAAAGVGFIGDHALLSDIYTKAHGEFDALVERAVGLCGERGVASPGPIATAAAKKLSAWPSPTSEPDAVLKAAVTVNAAFLEASVSAADAMKSAGRLTRGTDNLLAQMSDDHEVFAYKLGQRVR